MTEQKAGRERLPFEPRQKKKKTPKRPPTSPQKAQKSAQTLKSPSSVIPEGVSKRMVRRMALFSGIPTALGMASFLIAYWIVSHQWFDLPPIAVLWISLGFFGLGVLGLSYGIFSTSWDEQRLGGWWGWEEFKANFGRTIKAWRSSQQEAKEN